MKLRNPLSHRLKSPCPLAQRSPVEACLTTVLLGNEGVLVLDGRPNERLDLTREVQWRDHLREVL